MPRTFSSQSHAVKSSSLRQQQSPPRFTRLLIKQNLPVVLRLFVLFSFHSDLSYPTALLHMSPFSSVFSHPFLFASPSELSSLVFPLHLLLLGSFTYPSSASNKPSTASLSVSVWQQVSFLHVSELFYISVCACDACCAISRLHLRCIYMGAVSHRFASSLSLCLGPLHLRYGCWHRQNQSSCLLR